MTTSGPALRHERPDASEKRTADTEQASGGPASAGQSSAEQTSAGYSRLSGLGLVAGTVTALYLLSAVILGSQMSGLLGSNDFSAVFVTFFVLTMTALPIAIVLDVLLSQRGEPSSRTSLILGLLLLLPPTGVAFYVVNQSLL
ncbi:hypothetical protein B0I08_11272 [Glaciihabitans tibetensis]|uniref:Uncharacterized protein n=1 Tax=Glaciihabitans tibetensis TaxID=1266600 RepID=A0A2T0V3J2_9MICO|nr:hypothetical protein [Glaciihabitans tibetensis]PRY64687.1 hypothetical protein B0I08_11272 [Glaciihabitans tibetensis]